MTDTFPVADMTAAELWRQIEGFAPPCCPECGKAASLDDDGYWCEYCSDSEESNPAVDDISNGAEFDAYLAAYKAATQARQP